MTVAASPSAASAPRDLVERYANAVVRSCARLDRGDVLVVSTHPACRDLAVALAEAGYAAGAALVEIQYVDPLVQAARIRHAREEDLGPVTPWLLRRLREQVKPTTAMVSVLSDGDDDPLAGLPPERVARDVQRPAEQVRWYTRAVQQERRRWVGVAWPTAPWARRVYPELGEAEGERRLLDDLLWFCRLGPDDPPGAEGWEQHVEQLARRSEALTALRAERLELRGPGTELSFRLAPGTRWLGGLERNAHGHLLASNMPTEECYTTPHAASAEGVFRCSRPLSLHGLLIDGIAGELRGGRLVRLQAADDEQRDLLAAFLDSDPGARRIGEVALVDATSRIGQTGRVYANTLLDENAAAHVAFGFGFDAAREPGSGTRGVNRSALHLDVMIGTPELEATAIGASGRRVPLIADGTWQVA